MGQKLHPRLERPDPLYKVAGSRAVNSWCTVFGPVLTSQCDPSGLQINKRSPRCFQSVILIKEAAYELQGSATSQLQPALTLCTRNVPPTSAAWQEPGGSELKPAFCINSPFPAVQGEDGHVTNTSKFCSGDPIAIPFQPRVGKVWGKQKSHRINQRVTFTVEQKPWVHRLSVQLVRGLFLAARDKEVPKHILVPFAHASNMWRVGMSG
ncbi:hypothetical protein JZ751_021281 [Albula glossodonta]|uniref:Uncharacterized protein n=1 Tax=Albula glossodonta TaxID=121402 RepID=A0A8T2MSD9_9TELE|nr:hypothetical protein JZ751_021281 [Albula glossodonta]